MAKTEARVHGLDLEFTVRDREPDDNMVRSIVDAINEVLESDAGQEILKESLGDLRTCVSGVGFVMHSDDIDISEDE